jgi:flagellar protein FlgJ
MAVTDTAAYRLDSNRYSQALLDRLGDATDRRGAAQKTSLPDGADFSDFLKTTPADRDTTDSTVSGQTPPKRPSVDKTDKLYEQCEALETFLLKTLINGMRKTVDKTGINDGGFAGGIYEDMLYDEYAKDFTRDAKFGLAELAYLELTGQRGKLLRNSI